ncbi:DUF998 domain-containing protein [Rhizobium glycinendophyticum]|uniref:DUF998 domain-containing protein n=1 Tax=Rhizobium glycinendophyticum TaxID=2589807 RepID=A0A504U9A9_9HYPH|nr:DUF998 domain-containing protein [Rhizobium glycinendophyticum]TPP11784.1 DUF998 domain-containing protein [Rhizobium glycinendophyticum]
MSSLSLLSAGLALCQLTLFAVLHWRGPQYRLREPVSDYGTGPLRSLFAVYVLTGCAAVASLGAAVAVSQRLPLRAGVYLLLLAVIRLGVLRFPTDLGGMAKSRTGRLHLLFAIAGFALVYMAVDVLNGAAERVVSLAALPWLSGLHLIATVSLAATVVALLPALRALFGFAERAFILSTMVWLGLFAFAVA